MLHHGIVFPYSATIYRSAFALIAASSICPESFSTSARFNSLEEMGVLSGSNSYTAGGQYLSLFCHHRTSSAFFVLNVTVFSPGTRLAGISQTSEPPELGTIVKKK